MKRVAPGLTARVRRFVRPGARPGSERVVCHEWFAVLGGSDKVAAEFRMIEFDQIVVVRRIFGDTLVLDEAGVNAALFEVYRRRTRRMRGGQSSPAPDR